MQPVIPTYPSVQFTDDPPTRVKQLSVLCHRLFGMTGEAITGYQHLMAARVSEYYIIYSYCIFGASLSEPHTDELYTLPFYNIIFIKA